MADIKIDIEAETQEVGKQISNPVDDSISNPVDNPAHQNNIENFEDTTSISNNTTNTTSHPASCSTSRRLKALYLIVGPSGVGKSTIVEKICKEWGIKEVLSYTDRAKRSENEGTHIFVTPEEFTKLLPMVAYTKFDNHRYGVTADMIEDSDIYVIDPAGVLYFFKHYKGERPIRVIGLRATQSQIYRRIVLREGFSASANHRMQQDREIFSDSVMKLICDVVINVNESVAKAVRAVKDAIQNFEDNIERDQ